MFINFILSNLLVFIILFTSFVKKSKIIFLLVLLLNLNILYLFAFLLWVANKDFFVIFKKISLNQLNHLYYYFY